MGVKTGIKKGCFLLMFILIAGCSDLDNDAPPTVEEAAKEVIDLLIAEDYQEIHNTWFTEDLRASIPENELKNIWGQYAAEGEEFQEVQSLYVSAHGEDLTVAEAELEFVAANFELRLIFNENKQLAGFHVSDLVIIRGLPENIIEEEIIVGEGTDFPLEGILTLPKEREADLPAAVLVHGSGPSDKDETVFGYKPFRDIAWGLAEQGIASIRYDKRTYAYREEITEAESELTVYEETVEDALLATEQLKNDSRVHSDHIYLIGHSLGGMLAPRIEAQGGNYAGLIILAGTPRTLWEVVYDQNLAVIEDFIEDEAEKEEQRALVEKEYIKAQSLEEITKAEAKEMTVFGMNGYYLKEMDEYEAAELVSKLEKPLLVLQGEDDFQVYYEKAFAMWREVLEGNEKATFKSYPSLNHFFVDYQGPLKGTIAEYETPAEVEVEVVEDIANWILNQ